MLVLALLAGGCAAAPKTTEVSFLDLKLQAPEGAKVSLDEDAMRAEFDIPYEKPIVLADGEESAEENVCGYLNIVVLDKSDWTAEDFKAASEKTLEQNKTADPQKLEADGRRYQLLEESLENWKDCPALRYSYLNQSPESEDGQQFSVLNFFYKGKIYKLEWMVRSAASLGGDTARRETTKKTLEALVESIALQ